MSDTKQIAKAYIEQGWAVVPLVKGEKRASDSWNTNTYAPDDFRLDDGIAGKCGEPSGWRVDFDLDHPLAVQIAPLLLPNTGLIHGRPGKPLSHWWYVCEGIKTRQFTDVKDANGHTQMLIEIRSTGAYTALPPSGHPSGDVLAWASERTPLRLTPEEANAWASYVAFATLTAIHYPGPGARHEMVGHLAGFLCRHGVDAKAIPQIIHAIATVADDPSEVNDRVTFARNTVAKFDQDAPVTGGPKLAEALGQDVVRKMRACLGVSATDEAIEEMNQKHFWVRMGKDDVIGREDDPDEIVFQRPRALYSEYADRQVQVGVSKKGDPQFKPLVQAWLESPQRRRYRRVVFTPPPMIASPLDYNLWKGYAVEPRPATHKVVPILRHIREIICNNDPECYHYLMQLLALTVRQPGERTGIAVVMRSPEGAGKNVFVDFVGRLFHPHHYTSITKWDQAIGRFNASLKSKIIVFLNEVGATTKDIGSLKSLITDPTVNIEPKGIDAAPVDNHAHIFLATNEDWSVAVPEESRRYFFLRLSDRYAYGKCSAVERKAYFDPLWALVSDREALGGFLYRLLREDITDFDRFDKPVTAEEQEQRLRSLTGPMLWLFEVLETGTYGPLGWPTTDQDVSRVYGIYESWAQSRGQRALDAIQWGKKVAKYIWVDGKTRPTRDQNKPIRAGTLVSREELRKALPPLTDFRAEVVTYIVKTPVGMKDVHVVSDEATSATAHDDRLPF